MKTRKVGILGLGHVGAHVAYSLAIQGIASELVLVDPKESKLAAEVQDLRDAILYCPHDVKSTAVPTLTWATATLSSTASVISIWLPAVTA